MCINSQNFNLAFKRIRKRLYVHKYWIKSGIREKSVVIWQVSLFSIALIWAIRGQMAESTATSHIFIDDIRKNPQGSLASEIKG